VNDSSFVYSFTGLQPERLDKFLVAQLPEFSRTRLQDLIKAGQVKVGDRIAQKAGQLLEQPCQVEITIPPSQPSELIPEDIPLEIIFENADLMVVNKPAGMVVHPGAGHFSGTLVHAALAHAPGIEGIGGEERPGIVHRLDKDTSGLILLAKDDRAHRWLQEQFRLRRVQKVYLALVDSRPPTPAGRVEAAIGRSPQNRNRMAIVPVQKGREAISDYTTLEEFPRHTLLEVHPLTGRTHQIRLHLAFLGCPVAGDSLYGLKKSTLPLNRHFLHAYQLTIQLPGEDTSHTFTSPLPSELQVVINLLKKGSS
jgi:23S rRNA pseudouridine1911/1915/1917 synthase